VNFNAEVRYYIRMVENFKNAHLVLDLACDGRDELRIL
jgi:hypothetical protein